MCTKKQGYSDKPMPVLIHSTINSFINFLINYVRKERGPLTDMDLQNHQKNAVCLAKDQSVQTFSVLLILFRLWRFKKDIKIILIKSANLLRQWKAVPYQQNVNMLYR